MNRKLRPYLKSTVFLFLFILLVFFSLSPVYAQRAPIDVNLIIDSSSSLSNVKNDITTWVNARIDQILFDGDRVTVWSAGQQSRIIYTGKMDTPADKEAVKKSIRDITPAGSNPDFSGALRDASSKQSGSFAYTLLISASPQALSTVLSGPQASLLRFSRIEEFSNWRALVVGLNLDSRVKRSAASFFTQ